MNIFTLLTKDIKKLYFIIFNKLKLFIEYILLKNNFLYFYLN